MSPEILRYDSKEALFGELIKRLEIEVGRILSLSKDPVIALPTGNTMIPFYEFVCKTADSLHVSNWKCFQLDEYHPLSAHAASFSFRKYLQDHLYSKIKHPPKMQESLNGYTSDPKTECERYENRIQSEGGVDLAILGIGVNGHIAFNEPGSSFQSRTRLVTLDPETLRSNFKGSPPFQSAMTLGIGTILEARKIWVVALSKSKAKAVHSAITQPPSVDIPASALQEHPAVTWFLDQDAFHPD